MPAALNCTHLRAFWAVIREGGVSAAARALALGQSTVSEHVRALERTVGQTLLMRDGTRLRPTPYGRMIFAHADGIFDLAHQLDFKCLPHR